MAVCILSAHLPNYHEDDEAPPVRVETAVICHADTMAAAPNRNLMFHDLTSIFPPPAKPIGKSSTKGKRR